jgi:hypothetical protein
MEKTVDCQDEKKAEQDFSKFVDTVSDFVKRAYPHARKAAAQIKEHVANRPRFGKKNPIGQEPCT